MYHVFLFIDWEKGNEITKEKHKSKWIEEINWKSRSKENLSLVQGSSYMVILIFFSIRWINGLGS